MTTPKSPEPKSVRRWALSWNEDTGWSVDGYEMLPSGPTVVLASDHERVVAELKASIEHSETKVGWLLHDNEKNVREHERVVAKKDAAYNNLDDVNMALNEKIAKQAKVIEKLRERIVEWVTQSHSGDEHMMNMCLMVEDRIYQELAAVERGEA